MKEKLQENEMEHNKPWKIKERVLKKQYVVKKEIAKVKEKEEAKGEGEQYDVRWGEMQGSVKWREESTTKKQDSR